MNDPSHDQPRDPDRDSLLRIEIFGPSETTRAPASPQPGPPAGLPLLPSEHEHDLARREAELVRRERALSGSEGLVDATAADVERRERKLAHMEAAMHERLRELDERETLLEKREMELEGAFGLREDRIETREAELAGLDERLRRKEEDLARYVGQVQAQLLQRG
ncbi:MAG TPA: hypothetical protein VFR32_04610 [Gaiellaceae bacterium]|nr:hypothetical protein [Gaiellaceae bacterium]